MDWQTFWQHLNRPRSDADISVAPPGTLRRFTRRYLMGRLLPVLLGTMLCGTMMGLGVYGYAYASRIIADDIIEIRLESQGVSSSGGHDPSLPTTYRHFFFSSRRPHQGVDEAAGQKPGRTVPQKLHLLGWLIGGLLAMEAIRHAATISCYGLSVRFTQRVRFRLRQQLFRRMLQLPMSYHDGHSAGRLMTHLFSDLATTEMTLTHFSRNIPSQITTMLVGIPILIAIEPRLACIVLLTLPLFAVSYRWFSRRLEVVNQDLREKEGRLNAHIADRVSAFQLVKSYSRENHEAIDFVRQSRPTMEHSLASVLLGTCFNIVCAVLAGVSTACVLWMGTIEVRSGRLTLGQLLMFHGAAGYLFSPVAVLTGMVPMYHRMRVVAGRLMRVIDWPVQQVMLPSDEEGQAATRQSTTGDRGISVELRNVRLVYQQGRSPAIENLSFTLPAGKRLAVLGASGSGKSSIARLLTRLYDATQGQVLIGGRDVREIPPLELCRIVGLVPQESSIFSGTIGQNIRYGRPRASLAETQRAGELAQIDDFIQTLPEAYRTMTQERGLTLSGGQKQRLNLARAILHDPRLLVLDDCTSALDAETEARLIRSLDQAMAGRTTIVITHRMALACRCDLAMVLDQGRMVEFGPPLELREKNGPLGQMYRQQFSPA